MIIVTTLVIPPGGDAGPFNLYSDSDGYTVPFATNVSAAALQAGYSSTVPNDATIIRVISTGLCTNFIDLNINLLTTTTTTSSSTSTSTSSTTTTTTTICPCTYISITITEGYIIFSDTGSVQVTYTNCNGLPDSTTYTAAGTYTICSSNINSIQGNYLRRGVPQIVPVFPVNSGTLCCITTTSTTTICPCYIWNVNPTAPDVEAGLDVTYIKCNGALTVAQDVKLAGINICVKTGETPILSKDGPGAITSTVTQTSECCSATPIVCYVYQVNGDPTPAPTPETPPAEHIVQYVNCVTNTIETVIAYGTGYLGDPPRTIENICAIQILDDSDISLTDLTGSCTPGFTTTTTSTTSSGRTPIPLYQNGSEGTACDTSGAAIGVYMNTSSFATCTVLYANPTGLVTAFDGWYTDGTIFRYWNGSSFPGTIGTC
jgi:hypothetical protein